MFTSIDYFKSGKVSGKCVNYNGQEQVSQIIFLFYLFIAAPKHVLMMSSYPIIKIFKMKILSIFIFLSFLLNIEQYLCEKTYKNLKIQRENIKTINKKGKIILRKNDEKRKRTKTLKGKLGTVRGNQELIKLWIKNDKTLYSKI